MNIAALSLSEMMSTDWSAVGIEGWAALGIVAIAFIIYAIHYNKKKKQ